MEVVTEWSFKERNRVDLGFETLLPLIDEALDKHTPVKKCIRKKQKLVIKPVSMRDKLYKEMIKSKND